MISVAKDNEASHELLNRYKFPVSSNGQPKQVAVFRSTRTKERKDRGRFVSPASQEIRSIQQAFDPVTKEVVTIIASESIQSTYINGQTVSTPKLRKIFIRNGFLRVPVEDIALFRFLMASDHCASKEGRNPNVPALYYLEDLEGDERRRIEKEESEIALKTYIRTLPAAKIKELAVAMGVKTEDRHPDAIMYELSNLVVGGDQAKRAKFAVAAGFENEAKMMDSFSEIRKKVREAEEKKQEVVSLIDKAVEVGLLVQNMEVGAWVNKSGNNICDLVAGENAKDTLIRYFESKEGSSYLASLKTNVNRKQVE